MRVHLALVAGFLLGMSGCVTPEPQAVPCNSTADCPQGWICGSGLCRPVGAPLDSGTIQDHSTPGDAGTAADREGIDTQSFDTQTTDTQTTDTQSFDTQSFDTQTTDASIRDSASRDLEPLPTCRPLDIVVGSRSIDDDHDGFSEDIGDCDDSRNTVAPGMEDVFDGLDNNCNGVADEGLDDDCDGYLAQSQQGDDCNDQNAAIHPGASDDDPNDIDENCDGLLGLASSGDQDGDGYAALGTGRSVVDCQDLSANIHPGALDVPGNQLDEDCQGGDLPIDESSGVFVSPSGVDTNPGTRSAPKKRIGAGLALAEASDRVLFVEQGSYDEQVSSSTSIYGGLSASNGWQRVGVTTLTSSQANGTLLYVQAPPGRPVAVMGFDILASETQSPLIIGGGEVHLTHVKSTPSVGTGQAALNSSAAHAEILNCIFEGQVFARVDSGSLFALLGSVVTGAGMPVYLLFGQDFPESGAGGRAVLINNTILAASTAVTIDTWSLQTHTMLLYNNILTYTNVGLDLSQSFPTSPEIEFKNNGFFQALGDTDSCDLSSGNLMCVSLVDINACAFTGCLNSQGNVDSNPSFATDGWHLAQQSPLLGAGYGELGRWAELLATDLDGDPRPGSDGSYCVGADEIN